MKKLIFLVLLIGASAVKAAGPNDGLYLVDVSSAANRALAATVHQDGSNVVLVLLDLESNEFEAFQGARVGDQAELESILGAESSKYRANFAIGSARIVVESCDPGTVFDCLVPAGGIMILTQVISGTTEGGRGARGERL